MKKINNNFTFQIASFFYIQLSLGNDNLRFWGGGESIAKTLLFCRLKHEYIYKLYVSIEIEIKMGGCFFSVRHMI